jgi:hypothetical protein
VMLGAGTFSDNRTVSGSTRTRVVAGLILDAISVV